jgi:SAM domain (Sterile alpha motif)
MSMPPTQPIAEWLAKIDLERCAAAFAANDIDVSVLGHLTDTDSEKMRASRRKMSAALLLPELGKSA